jgi:uncharacterized membrane protein (DUF373 family)
MQAARPSCRAGEKRLTRKRLSQHDAQAFERVKSVILKTMIVLMTLTVIFSIFDLAYILYKDLVSPPTLLLDANDMKEIFGLFLLILIGLELTESVKTYLTEHMIHAEVEVILLIAMIAVARKVIVMDVDQTSFQTLFGIAAIIVGLAGGYYLLQRTRKDRGSPRNEVTAQTINCRDESS